MLHNNNFNDIDVVAASIASLAGLWGAIISFVRRDVKDFKMIKKISLFFMDMFVNVGLTLLVYLGLVGYGVNELLAVAISGFIGHQGTRSFYLAELIITEKLGAKSTFDEVKKDKNDTNIR